MHLTPREQDKLLIFTAAEVARRHLGPRLLVHLEPRADAVGQDVGHEETQVVPRRFVSRSRVAQADHQK